KTPRRTRTRHRFSQPSKSNSGSNWRRRRGRLRSSSSIARRNPRRISRPASNVSRHRSRVYDVAAVFGDRAGTVWKVTMGDLARAEVLNAAESEPSHLVMKIRGNKIAQPGFAQLCDACGPDRVCGAGFRRE